jgi:glutaredoxin
MGFRSARWAMYTLIALSVITASCNRVESLRVEAPTNAGTPESEAAVPAAKTSERPRDTDLTQVGPGGNTRIYYQFIDRRGAVRFVERLEDVPEKWRPQAGFVEMSSAPPLSPADAKRTRADQTGPIRLTAVSSTPDVILYSADWCGYCRKAKAHLEGRGVPYQVRDVDMPAAKRELYAKTGSKGIPAMDIGGRMLKGYNAGSYDSMLDSAGF